MKCLNWKVLAALAAAGLVMWGLAPGLAAAALPLLVLAACPLSMLVMMAMMGRMGGQNCGSEDQQANDATGAADEDARTIAELKARVREMESERAAMTGSATDRSTVPR